MQFDMYIPFCISVNGMKLLSIAKQPMVYPASLEFDVLTQRINVRV